MDRVKLEVRSRTERAKMCGRSGPPERFRL